MEACLSASAIWWREVLASAESYTGRQGLGDGGVKTHSIVNLGSSLRAIALEVLLGVGLCAAGQVALDIGGCSVGVA